MFNKKNKCNENYFNESNLLKSNNLRRYQSNSANNQKYKDLWIKSADLYIPQLNKLLTNENYKIEMHDINKFNKNLDSNELSNILKENNSDKSTKHNYHILYNYIINKLGRYNKLNVLEIGLGTNNPEIVSTMGTNGSPGASLYSWSKFLPNSNIYGADIDKEILFNDKNIKTCQVDQLDINSFQNLVNNFGKIKYDIIIDDGLHSIGANLNTLLFALENIKLNGWIIIEDIDDITNFNPIDFILTRNNKYKTYYVKSRDCKLYAINKVL